MCVGNVLRDQLSAPNLDRLWAATQRIAALAKGKRYGATAEIQIMDRQIRSFCSGALADQAIMSTELRCTAWYARLTDIVEVHQAVIELAGLDDP